MSNVLFKELEQLITEGDLDKLNEVLNDDNINIKDENGFTLLISSGYYCSENIELLKLLLDKGIDVNAKAYISHGTFEDMHSAAKYCQTYEKADALKLLIEYGLDVNEATKNGYSILMGAAANGHNEIFDILVEAGADINAVSKKGHFVLGNAAVAKNTHALKTLIDKGIDVNFVPEGEWSALMKAAAEARIDNMKLLIAHGADVSYVDGNGKKIIDIVQANYEYYNKNGYYDKANTLRNAMLLLQSAGATT